MKSIRLCGCVLIMNWKLLLPFPFVCPTAWRKCSNRIRSWQLLATAAGALFPAKRTGPFRPIGPISDDWGKNWPNPLPVCSALYSSKSAIKYYSTKCNHFHDQIIHQKLLLPPSILNSISTSIEKSQLTSLYSSLGSLLKMF